MSSRKWVIRDVGFGKPVCVLDKPLTLARLLQGFSPLGCGLQGAFVFTYHLLVILKPNFAIRCPVSTVECADVEVMWEWPP